VNPIHSSLARKRRLARDARAAEYAAADGCDAEAAQLAQFNGCWEQMQKYAPYYARLVEQKKAPRQFGGWEQFLQTLPVADRKFVYENLPELSDCTRRPDTFRTTGGSTAEPVSLPAWDSETGETERNEWLGRSWYGIGPEDACFRLWGHSHLLGAGVRGWINARKREFKDALLGIERISAYDLSDRALTRAFAQMQFSNATYMVGYSAALDRFARVASAAGLENRTALKAIVATSESFPRADSRKVIEEAFHAPVAMEYGSVETGVLAHTRRDEGYHVFWLSYFIEATEPAPQGGYKVRVTSLYPRCFPLVRYDLGDAIALDAPCFGVRYFPEVRGRTNVFLEPTPGEPIHSEALSHAVKGIASVSGYQMIQENDSFTLSLTTLSSITKEQTEEIRSRLSKISPRLCGTVIRVVDRLEQTRAGKTPMIIRR